jgi:hypothetical protein
MRESDFLREHTARKAREAEFHAAYDAVATLINAGGQDTVALATARGKLVTLALLQCAENLDVTAQCYGPAAGSQLSQGERGARETMRQVYRDASDAMRALADIAAAGAAARVAPEVKDVRPALDLCGHMVDGAHETAATASERARERAARYPTRADVAAGARTRGALSDALDAVRRAFWRGAGVL